MAERIKDIISLMEKWAPASYAESWDNPGLIVGKTDKEVSKILVALDCTDGVIEEAIMIKADMIITHHPLIFKGIKSITDETGLGRRIIRLIENDISFFSAHTNLDIANGGTNTTLFDMLGLKNPQNLFEPVAESGEALGKIGEFENELSFGEFIEIVKKALGLEKIVVCGDKAKRIKKVGLCTGSASSMEYFELANEKECDCYISGDLTYHNAQNAVDLGLCVIDATHFHSEKIVVPRIVEYLNKNSKGRFEAIASANMDSLLEIK